jgi:hypothetical protein
MHPFLLRQEFSTRAKNSGTKEAPCTLSPAPHLSPQVRRSYYASALHSVRLTSTGNPVPGNQEFCFAPSETMVEQINKIRSLRAKFEDEVIGSYAWS